MSPERFADSPAPADEHAPDAPPPTPEEILRREVIRFYRRRWDLLSRLMEAERRRDSDRHAVRVAPSRDPHAADFDPPA